MTCFSAKRKSTSYFDSRLRDRERSRIQEHLRECDPCTSYFEQIRSVRTGLTRLPQPAAPASLRTRLQIIASRERQMLTTRSGSRLEEAWENWRFRMNEWMRPLTIPATGGIVSSLLLSCMFGLCMATNTRTVAYEVPVEYHDQEAVNNTPTLVPMSLRSSLLLNMSLDGHGHIQDFSARDASAQYTGDSNDFSGHDISLPDFPHPALSGDISILVTPVVYIR